jgi:hypothetical protein
LTIIKKNHWYYAGMATGIIFLIGAILGGIITPDYSSMANTISELFQSGAENRFLFSSIFTVNSILIVLFAIGIIMNHPYKKYKSIFVGGMILMVIGIGYSVEISIFPMVPVGTEATFQGTMHMTLVWINVLLTIILFPYMGLGLFRHKNLRSFKLFSFICLAIFLISAGLSPVVEANGIEAIGATSRIAIFTFYIWLFVLAYQLTKEQKGQMSSNNE